MLKDSNGLVTENDFVRRYRTVMDTSEIDHVEQLRNWPTVAVLGTLVAIGAVVAVWGVANLATPCEADDPLFRPGCDHRLEAKGSGYRPLSGLHRTYFYDSNATSTNDAGMFAAVLGAIGATAAGVGLGVALANGDGDPLDHTLTRPQTQRYVQRYNDRLPATGQTRGRSRPALPALGMAARPDGVSIVGAF